jgi:hypothetical protein
MIKKKEKKKRIKRKEEARLGPLCARNCITGVVYHLELQVSFNTHEFSIPLVFVIDINSNESDLS